MEAAQSEHGGAKPKTSIPGRTSWQSNKQITDSCQCNKQQRTESCYKQSSDSSHCNKQRTDSCLPNKQRTESCCNEQRTDSCHCNERRTDVPQGKEAMCICEPLPYCSYSRELDLDSIYTPGSDRQSVNQCSQCVVPGCANAFGHGSMCLMNGMVPSSSSSSEDIARNQTRNFDFPGSCQNTIPFGSNSLTLPLPGDHSTKSQGLLSDPWSPVDGEAYQYRVEHDSGNTDNACDILPALDDGLLCIDDHHFGRKPVSPIPPSSPIFPGPSVGEGCSRLFNSQNPLPWKPNPSSESPVGEGCSRLLNSQKPLPWKPSPSSESPVGEGCSRLLNSQNPLPWKPSPSPSSESSGVGQEIESALAVSREDDKRHSSTIRERPLRLSSVQGKDNIVQRKRRSFPHVDTEASSVAKSYSEKPKRSFKTKNPAYVSPQYSSFTKKSGVVDAVSRDGRHGKGSTGLQLNGYPRMSSFSSEEDRPQDGFCSPCITEREKKEETLMEKWKRSGVALRKFISDKFSLNQSSSKKKLRDDFKESENRRHVQSPPDAKAESLDNPLTNKSGRFVKQRTDRLSFSDVSTDVCTSKSESSSPTKTDKHRSFLGSFWKNGSSKSRKNDRVVDSDKKKNSRKKIKFKSSPVKFQSSESSITDSSSMYTIPGESDNSSNQHGCYSHNHSCCTSKKCKKRSDWLNDSQGRPIKHLVGKPRLVKGAGRWTDERYLHRGNIQGVSLLDRELSSSEEELTEVAESRQRPRLPANISSASQDNTTPQGSPTAPFLSQASREALSGLRYAIPYLPERFRRHLPTSDQSSEDRNQNPGQTLARAHIGTYSLSRRSRKCRHRRNANSKLSAIAGQRDKMREKSPLPKKASCHGNADRDSHSTSDTGAAEVNQRSRSRTHGEMSSNLFGSFRSRAHRRSSDEELLLTALDEPLLPDLPSFHRGDNSYSDAGRVTYLGAGVDGNEADADTRMLTDMVSTMNALGNAINGLCESISGVGLNSPDAGSFEHNELESPGTGDDLDLAARSTDSGEADDEFECDCEYCGVLQQHSQSTDVRDLVTTETRPLTLTQRREELEDSAVADPTALWLPDADTDSGLFRISVIELTPLDFMLMAESRFILDMMFENVILQMLAVHPELLSEQAPLPATETVIDSLPTVNVSPEHIDQMLSCSICLCPCELQEVMSRLPCQHLFHPMCIRAWLVKSGTCPVCRKVL